MTTLREAAQLALDALHLWHWTKETTGFDAAHDALRDAILEPAPEPVADTESDVLTATYMLGVHAGKKSTNRQPLTDEQLVEAYCCVNDKEWAIGGMTDARIFARAIERAHGIGGKE
jgi:hypothetical protein